MLGVIIHWDHKPGLESVGCRQLFQHYDYACRAYKADKVVFIDETSDLVERLHPAYTVVASMEAAIRLFEPYLPQLITIQPNGAARLADIEHPDDAVYIFGPDLGGMAALPEALSVRIPMVDRSMELWASQALAIVLYDRFVRE